MRRLGRRNGQGRIIRAGIYRHVRGEIRVSSDAARARHVLKRGKEVALMGWDLNFVRRLRHDGLKLTCGSWFQLHQFELNLLPRGEVPLVLVLVGGSIDNKMRGIQRNGFIGRGSFFLRFIGKSFFSRESFSILRISRCSINRFVSPTFLLPRE